MLWNEPDKIGGCIIVVMSHGIGAKPDIFSDQKGEEFILKKHILTPFNAENCSVLQHIPKIFLINICRYLGSF